MYKSVIQCPPLNWIMNNLVESAAYCKALPDLSYLQTLKVKKKRRFFNHSIIVITFMSAQSDPIKWRTLCYVSLNYFLDQSINGEVLG
jgi:hypothetical protein